MPNLSNWSTEALQQLAADLVVELERRKVAPPAELVEEQTSA